MDTNKTLVIQLDSSWNLFKLPGWKKPDTTRATVICSLVTKWIGTEDLATRITEYSEGICHELQVKVMICNLYSKDYLVLHQNRKVTKVTTVLLLIILSRAADRLTTHRMANQIGYNIIIGEFERTIPTPTTLGGITAGIWCGEGVTNLELSNWILALHTAGMEQWP